MSQADWYRHEHSSGLLILQKRLTLRLTLDWPDFIDSVAQTIANAIRNGSQLDSAWLEPIWIALQDAYKDRLDFALSPVEWLLKLVEYWKLMLSISHLDFKGKPWAGLADELTPWLPGVQALSLSTR